MNRPFDPISNAMDLIIKYHGDQKRKAGGQAFIIHLLEVANLIYKGFPEATPDLIAAGLCHDLLEDTECTENEISEACGDFVLEIVKTVTNDPNLDGDETWEEKKLDYLDRVSKGSRESQIVCLCDKIANMRSLLREYQVQGEEVWKNFNRGKLKKRQFEELMHTVLKTCLRPHQYIYEYDDLIDQVYSENSRSASAQNQHDRERRALDEGRLKGKPIDNSDWASVVWEGEREQFLRKG